MSILKMHTVNHSAFYFLSYSRMMCVTNSNPSESECQYKIMILANKLKIKQSQKKDVANNKWFKVSVVI